MFQLSIPVRTRGAMAMTTPDIRLHALNWPCSVYVIINLPQHGLAVCNMIWTLTYMYVYSDSYRLYRLLWGLVTKAKLGKKNKQCTCHRKSPNLSGLMCISWYIAQIEEICWLEQSFLLDQCHLPKELKKMQISWIMYNMSKINLDLINSCLLTMKASFCWHLF